MSWSAEQVLALAPDPSSAKSGKDLATPRKWVTLGHEEGTAWGECQGSGSSPYQTKIDLGEPAFHCSCPSRKFPCKHALGLFLILAQQPAAFKGGPPPPWVAEWLEGRAKRAETKAKKAQAQQEQAEADPEAAAKAEAKRQKAAAERQAKVDAGLDDLGRWLGDVARRGLAAARSEDYAFWERPAARLVDAQAGGAARLVRDLPGVAQTGEGWERRLLERLGRIHLLVEGHRRLDALPPESQADVRSAIGWTIKKEELRADGGVRDRWAVLGQRVEEEDRLRVQRRWLRGEQTGRPALVLHFAVGNAPLDASLLPGTVVDAELVFYPGAVPLRAEIKERHGSAEPLGSMRGYESVAEALAAYADALTLNPWLERFPIALRAVRPARIGGGWWAVDAEGARMPISPKYARGWELLALGGGRPVGLAGEWDGDELFPLGLWAEGRFLPAN